MNKILQSFPAIFIDRDGVVIHNKPDYVRSLQQVKIYPRAIKAIVMASKSEYSIVMVTNQAGVGKGLYSIETVNEINNEIVRVIENAGGRIDGVYICPHKSEDNCICRKPKPGLIKMAARELGIDLSNSVMVGDAITDIIAGQCAGVRHSILVLTGRGKAQVELSKTNKNLSPFIVRKSLLEAINYILALKK